MLSKSVIAERYIQVIIYIQSNTMYLGSIHIIKCVKFPQENGHHIQDLERENGEWGLGERYFGVFNYNCNLFFFFFKNSNGRESKMTA